MTINYQALLKFFLALFISGTVFLFIQLLISQSANLKKKNTDINYVEFIRVNEDDNLQERKRTIPEKPPTPKRPPQPEIELDDIKPPPMASLDIDVPDFSLPTDFSGAFLGNIDSLSTGTSQLIPIVKVAPRCPREAQINGINGSVTLLLNVSANGRIDSVKVTNSKPPRLFDSEAIKAVRRWQFKPKTVDGVSVDQMGELLVEFSCNV